MKPRHLVCVLTTLILATSSAFAADDKTYCSLPGLVAATDAKGDATDPVVGAAPYPIPGSDVLDTFIAELPNDSGEEKVYFTVKVDSAAPQFLPGTSYQIKFTLKDGVQRFVLFNPYPTPAATPIAGTELKFGYGHNGTSATGPTFTIDGPADAESSANPDGTITIVLSSKQIKQLKPGEIVSDVTGVSQFNGIAVTSDLDMSDAPGAYELQGNDSCKTKKSADAKAETVSDKSGTSFGGALAPGLLMLLLGIAGLRRRIA